MIPTFKELLESKKYFPLKFGFLAGLVMAFILFLFQLAQDDFDPVYKLVKYVPFTIIVFFALKHYKTKYDNRVFFPGMWAGFRMSIVAALTMITVSGVLYLISPDLAFSKYGLSPVNEGQFLMIAAILIIETMIYGSILTFTICQYLKEPGVRARSNRELKQMHQNS